MQHEAVAPGRIRALPRDRPLLTSSHRVLLGQLGVVTLGVLAIELLVRAGGVSPLFLSAPSQVFPLFLAMLPTELVGMALQTLSEVALALMIGATAGILFGYALWRFATAGRAYEALLAAVFATPLVLLYPISLVLFGRTPSAVVAMAVISSIVPITLNTRNAFAAVPPVLVNVGRSLNLSEQRIFREIMLPAAAPGIFAGLRLGLSYIFKATLVLEFIVNIGGLGRRAALAYDLLDIPRLYASVLAVVLLSVLFVFALNQSERWLKRG